MWPRWREETGRISHGGIIWKWSFLMVTSLWKKWALNCFFHGKYLEYHRYYWKAFMLPGICPCSLFHEKIVSFTFFLEGWGIDQQGVQISQDLQWKQTVCRKRLPAFPPTARSNSVRLPPLFSNYWRPCQSSQMVRDPQMAFSWVCAMSTLIICTGWQVSCSQAHGLSTTLM